MQNFKNRLYEFESPAPEAVWNHIADGLDNKKLPKPKSGKTRLMYYAMAAAAALVIIFLGKFYFNNNSEQSKLANELHGVAPNSNSVISNDSVQNNKQVLESIINTPKPKPLLADNKKVETGVKKYITISGPEGQPIKISRKAASLIISVDNEYPPKPIWDKKIEEWKKMMLSNTSSSTPSGLMDMLQAADNMDK
ncbi:MAG: hypothetical protein ABI208_06750 [Ginsengibacter sp.]|jgi:hypothetical protein